MPNPPTTNKGYTVHLIPSPKQLLFQTGGCDVERGLAFDDRLAPLAAKADNFNLPSDPSGIPVHLAFAALPIPEAVHHAKLVELQAYRLEIAAHEITITVSDLQGAYAALATLRQIVRQYPTRNLPCLTIFDYPTVPFRGIMVDVSRGKIPNRKTFTRLVQLSFAYKLNVLQLYWEDCYRLSRHSQVGTLNGWYDQKEVAWMEKLCQAYGVELQANIQTFSHMQGLLRLPGFSHLAENDSLFTLAPGNGDVYTLLDEILGEVLPWFSSKTVHLNMDEAYDLGTGFSLEQAADVGKEQVYVDHINKVAALARKHGAKKMLIWGDALAKYPHMPDKVGSDVVFVDWNYNPEHHFPSLDIHDGLEREFWIAPGTSSWNAIFPRLQNSFVNMKNYIQQAVQKATKGVLVTHWGDYGHHQPFSFSYLGYIYGAEQAYNGGQTGQAQFEQAAEALVYDDDHQIRAVQHLAATNELPAVQVGFKSQTLYALFDDFFKGLTIVGDERYPAIPTQTHAGLVRLGEAAEQELLQADANRSINKELLLAARMLVLAGKKGLLSHEIRTAFLSKDVDERKLLQWIFEIKTLFARFSLLRQEFTLLWEEEALVVGREGALYLFDKAATRFDEAVRFLARQLLALRHGEALDATMETYTANESYTTLWTMDCLNLWDRAYPWR